MAFIPDAQVAKKKSSFVPDSGSYRNDMTMEQYWTGAAKNILPSAGRTAMAMGSGILNIANPNIDDNTLAQTAKLAYGGLQKLDPTKDKVISRTIAEQTPLKYVTMADKARGMSTDYQPQADAVGKFYGDRYGGIENIKKSVYEDPTGVALDASMLLGGGAGVAKGVAGATGSTNAARVATALGTASKYTNPLTYAGKATGIVTKPVQKMSKFLASEAESLPTRGMGNPMGLKNAKGVSPLPMDELFEKYNTWERTPEAFQAGIDTAKTQGRKLAQTAEQTGSKVDLLKVLDKLNENIKKLSSRARTSDKAMAELQELTRRKQMLVESMGEGSYTPLKVSPAKVTKIKQDFQADMPDSAFGKPMSEMNKASGTKKAYQSLIGGIEEAVPGTKNLGREESALIRLKEIAENQNSRLGARQNVNFSRLGGAGLGGLIGGIPGAIQGYALEQVANSPQFLRLASKGARKVSNIFSGVGKAPASIPKAPNLTSGERAVEKLFAQDILDDTASYISKQKERFGKFLNADDNRTFSDIYDKNKSLSAAVHEPTSYLTNRVYDEALLDPNIRNILYTAGPTGAGKTSALKAFDKIQKFVDQADMVYDTNLMNGEKAVSKISKALDQNKKVGVIYTEANILDGWRRVIDRAIKSGRTVPKDIHLETYLKSPEAFQYIREKLGNRIKTKAIRNLGNRIKTKAIRNIGEAVDRKMVDPSSILKPAINEEAVLVEMQKLIETYYSEGKITNAQRAGLSGNPQKTAKDMGSYKKRSFGERSNVFKTAAGIRDLKQE